VDQKKHFFKKRKGLYYWTRSTLFSDCEMSMKSIALLVACAGLFSCKPVFDDKVIKERVQVPAAASSALTATVYRHHSAKPEAAILLLCRSAAEQQAWDATASRMAVQKYLVLSVVSARSNSTDVRAAAAYLAGQYAHLPYGLVGAGENAAICLSAGSADSAFAAAALLTPSPDIEQVDSLCRRSWQGRPVLLLAAQQGGLWSTEQAQRFYDGWGEPKKLVWLATAKSGAALLGTDLEPIIRRTMVLMFDRHLRGKK